jgi:hypothetical protein
VLSEGVVARRESDRRASAPPTPPLSGSHAAGLLGAEKRGDRGTHTQEVPSCWLPTHSLTRTSGVRMRGGREEADIRWMKACLFDAWLCATVQSEVRKTIRNRQPRDLGAATGFMRWSASVTPDKSAWRAA